MLIRANEAIEENENFKFADADMHSKLKFILNNPLTGKYVKQFKNQNDVINIIPGYCEEGEF